MSMTLSGLLLGVRFGPSHFAISLLITFVIAPGKTCNLNRKDLAIACGWLDAVTTPFIAKCGTHLFENFSGASLIAAVPEHNTESEKTYISALFNFDNLLWMGAELPKLTCVIWNRM